ncbi:Crp/Fnr family transcriptional regulator [Variovorax sp. PAMC 28711]|uniref:Crp/Fnr family transcriptional regulator n=1 Tax=Variovorax sp. PAMC 28711 TaxID=1795631 RepID=UPI00078B59D2|nr:cyclic nucleotide-binding domain-containing protein [Variovorax sp. PAMC 28711]AMM22948.1 cyclic nucleotide-binding protein [Variovorax sp. PAMC 28711]
MLAARVELLQQMPIFGAIGAATLEFLLAPAAIVEKAAGDFFFREGDPAQSMYVLETGRVTVSKSWQEHDLLLRRLGQGDCFGEMALLDLFPRSASVRADADCCAIELTPANLYRLFERDAPQFALIQMNIGREISRRLRITDELLFRARMGDLPATPERIGKSTAR